MAQQILTISMVWFAIMILASNEDCITTEDKKFNLVINLLMKFHREIRAEEQTALIIKHQWVWLPLFEYLLDRYDLHEALESFDADVETGYFTEGEYLQICKDIKAIFDLVF